MRNKSSEILLMSVCQDLMFFIFALTRKHIRWKKRSHTLCKETWESFFSSRHTNLFKIFWYLAANWNRVSSVVGQSLVGQMKRVIRVDVRDWQL